MNCETFFFSFHVGKLLRKKIFLVFCWKIDLNFFFSCFPLKNYPEIFLLVLYKSFLREIDDSFGEYIFKNSKIEAKNRKNSALGWAMYSKILIFNTIFKFWSFNTCSELHSIFFSDRTLSNVLFKTLSKFLASFLCSRHKIKIMTENSRDGD